MSTAGPSRAKLAAVALLLVGLGVAGLAMWWTSTRELMRDWGTDRLSFGPGIIIAMPAFAAALFALAVATVRAMIASRSPGEYIRGWVAGVGLVAVASIVVALVAGFMVGNRLRDDGYRRCSRGYTPRLGIEHWVRDSRPCETGEQSR